MKIRRPSSVIFTHRIAAWAAVFVFVPAIVTPVTASAIVPGGTTTQSDLIAAPPFAVPASSVDQVALAEAESRLEAFGSATGTRWEALDWSPVSLTPGLASGTGLDLGSSIPDQNAAVQAARKFVLAHPDLFRAGDARLGVPRVRFGLGKWSVQWEEQVAGIPILHSRVNVLLTQSGRLAAFGASTYPAITQASPPALSPSDARRIARAHLVQMGLIPGAAAFTQSGVRGPFVLPVLRDRAGGGGASSSFPATVEGRTILRVSFACSSPPAAFEVDVDATTGEVLQRTNSLRQDYSGTVGASIEVPSWCAGYSEHPAPHLQVMVANVGDGVTGPDGAFLIPSQSAEPETLAATLTGPFLQVQNLEGVNARLQHVIEPEVPLDLRWDDDSSRPEERDAFCYAMAMHDLIKSCDPAWTDMDFPVVAYVDYDASCNAFWNPEDHSMTFFHEVDGCANTARLIDIVAHEYSHGITQFIYGENQPPGDLHEGNSDVGGFYLTNNPKEAVGFYLDDCINGIRNADNDLRWPDDRDGDVDGHDDGQIISGFCWHARAGLIQELGYEAGTALGLSIWHFSRELGRPQNQPEEVWWAFLVDDNDGNLDNGTPHWTDLAQAAGRHGFVYPEKFEHVVIHHDPLYCATAPNGESTPLEAVLYSLTGPLNPDSLLVHYRAAGGQEWGSAPFVPAEGQNQYQATIPGGWQGGTEVEYWVGAADADGNRLRRPATGAYAFVVGYSCDDFEGATEWTVGGPGDTAPWYEQWELVVPVGRSWPDSGWVSPPFDATPDPGDLCWVAGQRQSVAGQTTLASPMYDLTGMRWAAVRYQRWFQNLQARQATLVFLVNYNGSVQWDTLDVVRGRQDPAQWTLKSFDLQPPGGNFGRTRFRLVLKATSNRCTDVGGLDDLVLLAGQEFPLAVPDLSQDVPAQLSFRLTAANPMIGLAAFRYTLPSAGPVRLDLYRVDGSLVRTLVDERATAGVHHAIWDGRDCAGRVSPSGVYFARVRSNSGSQTERVVIAR